MYAVGKYVRRIPTKPVRAVSILKHSGSYIYHPLQHWSALYCLPIGKLVAVHDMKAYVGADL